MNAQQLKNAILQEAIEGRLVPQDPNDEPASILLARIRAEKERLVKEGKLKEKDLEVKPISEDEIPFEIPKSWVWCRIGDIIEFVNGRAYKKDELLDSGKYKVLRVGNFFTNDSWYYSDLELPDDKYCYQGDLLYAWSASFGPKIWDGDKTIFHYHIWNVKYSKTILWREYLYYFFLADKIRIRQATTGSTMIHVSMENMKPRLIPIPPLAEQYRIVAKIEELLPKVEEYGKAQDELNKLNEELAERLKKSILQEAITGRLVPQNPNDEPASVLLARIRKEKERLVKEGKLKKKDLEVKPISEDEIPFEIPESWEWVRVKEIVSKIVDGDHNPPKGLSSDSGYYMLSSKNINNNGIAELDSVRYLSYEDWKKCNERTNLQKGDVLLTTVGTLGRSCVYEGNKPYCFQRSVSIIQTFAFNYYLKYSFDSLFFQSLIDDKATGTAQRGFYLNQLENAIIPLPPLAEQKRIVEKIEQLLGEIDKLNK